MRVVKLDQARFVDLFRAGAREHVAEIRFELLDSRHRVEARPVSERHDVDEDRRRPRVVGDIVKELLVHPWP